MQAGVGVQRWPSLLKNGFGLPGNYRAQDKLAVEKLYPPKRNSPPSSLLKKIIWRPAPSLRIARGSSELASPPARNHGVPHPRAKKTGTGQSKMQSAPRHSQPSSLAANSQRLFVQGKIAAAISRRLGLEINLSEHLWPRARPPSTSPVRA